MTDDERTFIVKNLLRRLKYRGCEYVSVNEWSNGHRHHHVIIRTADKLTPAEVRPLAVKSLKSAANKFPGHPPRTLGKDDLSVKPARNPVGLAKYVVKDLKDRSKAELPPRSFRGHVLTMTRTFLVRKLPELWAEVKAEWYGDTEDTDTGENATEDTSTAPPHEHQGDNQDTSTEDYDRHPGEPPTLAPAAFIFDPGPEAEP